MKKKRTPDVRKILLAILLSAAGTVLLAFLLSRVFPEKDPSKEVSDRAPAYVKKMYLKENPYSRPQDPLTEVRNIVIHYVGNPGTSAEANRNYFDNLRNKRANPSGTKASAHFIVGLSGEVIQCIPLSEIAYANAPRNNDTVSVEVCHPDETGVFSEETYEAAVKLAADLLTIYGLGPEALLRHYDISGKLCPKYYAENEDAWEQFKQDVGRIMQTGGTE